MDSNYQITAIAPPMYEEKAVELKIEVDGEFYTTGSLVFNYRQFFDIVDIQPKSGPSRGGTVVQVSINGNIPEPIY